MPKVRGGHDAAEVPGDDVRGQRWQRRAWDAARVAPVVGRGFGKCAGSEESVDLTREGARGE
jgi:hypothetical protein